MLHEYHVIWGWANNYPQCSCICVSVGSTVVFTCIARRGFLLITTVQFWSCSVSSFVVTVTLTMAALLSVCTKEEQRSVIRFFVGWRCMRGRNPSKTFSTIREQCFAATQCLRMDRKIKKWSQSVSHEEGAGRPSTTTTDDNIERVRDMVLLDRRLTDEVANFLQITKNDVIISFLFLFK
jgi:hypothetical protein